MFVALARVELARPLLDNRFSYHTCFYTSKLKNVLVYPMASHLELFRRFCSFLSFCGLDYFITILVDFEVRNWALPQRASSFLYNVLPLQPYY